MPIDPLEIQLLGGFRIRRGSGVIPDDAWKLRKAAGIVKLLALEPGHRLHREQVLDTLWPELEPEAAANNFRYALHTARQILDPERVDAGRILFREGRHLVLTEPEDIWVDVAMFESAVDAAWRGNDLVAHRAAVKLYAGDLLPDDRYEEWLDTRRTALRTNYLTLLNRMSRLYQERDDNESAIEILRQLIAADPLQEEAHAQLILIYARAGKQREALAQYDRLVATLDTELGVEPELVTQELARAVRAGQLVKTPAAATPASRTNLPAPVSTLLGRERELAEVRQALAGARLITLTGPGGIGKTRLALAVAAEQQQSFADGMFVVMLASLSDPGLVAATVIQTLGIRETSGQSPVETLLHFLSGKALLLVLDNFEQIVAAAPLVSTLLEGCSRLKIVVTSRMSLRVRGEQEYPVRPLDLPDLDDARPLMEYAAAALFIQRSREVKPDFNSDIQATAVAEICHRLDGMPLAIELAAARSKVLTPAALLARLEHPLSLLTGGNRDLPERQRTLRNTIAWSYNLLGLEGQRLFRSLSVFRGGWTLEAAEEAGEGNALDTLTALVENNLVEQQEQPDGEPRFRMLETIREFGLEQLAACEEERPARKCHALYFAGLVAEAPPFMRGPDQIAWLNRLEGEHANLQSALDWFAAHDIEAGLRTITPLWRFWYLHGHLTIGKRYFDTLLERAADAVDPATMAAALTGAGVMTEFQSDLEWDRAIALHEQALSVWLDLRDPPEGAYWSYLSLGNIALRKGNLPEAKAHFEESLEYTRRHNQPYGRVVGLSRLANVTFLQGDIEQAGTYFRESLALAREFGDPWSIGINSANLGVCINDGRRYDEARLLITEGMELHRLLGNNRDVAISLTNLGWIEFEQGHLAEAAALYDEGIDVAFQLNDSRAIGLAQCGLGQVALQRGEFESACDLFRQSLQSCRNAGEVSGIAAAVEALAGAYIRLANPTRAIELFACAAAYRERIGTSLTGTDLIEVEQGIEAVRDALTLSEFDTAWAAGLLLTPDDIA